MKKTTAASVIALSLVLVGNVAPQLGLGISPAAAQQTKGKTPPLNPKIGKPLQEAQNLINEKKFKDALAKLAEVEQMPNKSPYETYLTNLFALNCNVQLQDWGSAAKSLEAMLATGQVPPEEAPARTKALAQIYYQAKNYPKVIEWGQKYVAQTQDPEIEILIAQSYYLQKNFKSAAEAARQALKFADAKGEAPRKDWLDILLSSEYELGDDQGTQSALEQLVQRFPDPKYWSDLLTMAQKNLRGGTTKNALDIYRIMLVTGTMKEAADYMDMAETCIQQGLPGEAKKVMEKAMQSGVLSQPKDKDRAQRLLNMATTQAATDQKGLDAGAAEADKQKSGDADVKFGEAYWSYGQYDKAVEFIQKGIAKGVTDKNDAQLRLGITYLSAGKRQQALEAFKQIAPNTPSGSISRLWTLYSATRQSASAQ